MVVEVVSGTNHQQGRGAKIYIPESLFTISTTKSIQPTSRPAAWTSPCARGHIRVTLAHNRSVLNTQPKSQQQNKKRGFVLFAILLSNGGDCSSLNGTTEGYLRNRLRPPHLQHLSPLGDQYSFSSRTALTVRIIDVSSGLLGWEALLF